MGLPGVALDFNVNGKLYSTENGEIDTSLWSLNEDILTIIEEGWSGPDTIIASATQNNGNLVFNIVEDTDADNLKYIEEQFNLDKGSLTKNLVTEVLIFSHTELNNNYLELPKQHSNKTNVQMQKANNKRNSFLEIHSLF